MLAPAIMVTFIAADADGARFVEVRKPLRMVRLQRSRSLDHERTRVNVNTTDAKTLRHCYCPRVMTVLSDSPPSRNQWLGMQD